MRACDLGVESACAAAAEQAEVGSGQPLDMSSRFRAALLFGRACAAGDQPSCTSAEALRAAKALAEGRTLSDVSLGEADVAFDVRWGVWFEHAPIEVVWVASPDEPHQIETRLSLPIAQGRVRIYAPEGVPPGPKPPPGARTIYAVAGHPSDVLGGNPRPCPECTPDAHQRPAFWPIGCTCLP